MDEEDEGGGDEERQELVGGGAEAGGEADGDLELLREILRAGGEDEFQQAPEGEGGAEARHDEDDDRAAPGAERAEEEGVDEEGQGLAEYALILALIAIVAIVALIFLGGQVSTILSTVGSSV